MPQSRNEPSKEQPQPVHAPGLGATQRSVLELLKRRGRSTIAQVATSLGLNVETVREHVRALGAQGLVARLDGAGTGARRGRGRPELVYGLTPSAERLFPRAEGEILQELAAYLRETGNEELLGDFFERYIGARREDALERVRGLRGSARLAEVARILSELGFMAEVEAAESPRLRLCHCPLRDLVDVTRVPCRAEIGFVAELMGEPLTRLNYMPAGDACCSYRGGGADAA